MRIVAGRFRGRELKAPKGRTTRPTASRAREGLFNILAHGGAGLGGAQIIEGSVVLEAFAGTGAFSFEALSRGAALATLLDLDEGALDAARDNARALGVREQAHILRMDAVRPRTAERKYDLVFLDPPYGSKLGGKALQALARKGWIADGAVAIIEVAAKEDFHPPAGFEAVSERSFGAARFVFMRFDAAAASAAENA
jgi:16S rRNA (guanine966-N2)-methyltransferase